MAKLLTKKTSVGGGGEGWGMGFFLVFFPQEHTNNNKQDLSFRPQPTTLKCSKYSTDLLISKAQSTISICALLFFFTLLLFTLSTFEPNNTTNISYRHRRALGSKPNSLVSNSSSALQRLGTLYSRGTKPMNDITLCHVSESITIPQLTTFLRAFHRSGLLSKTDLVFIFPSPTTPDSFDVVIRQENDLFFKLIRRYKSGNNRDSPSSFDVTQFVKSGKKEPGKPEPIWGGKKKSNSSSNSSNGDVTELSRLSHGSVVGFGVGELDPENSLSGFLDHVPPMGLRRWASYPMILGRLRRNFKHVMLVDVKEVLLLGDPLVRVRNRSPESVFFSPTTKHNRKPTDKKTVNPAVIMGGARGVRRLSAAMLTEIVRASTTHNNKRKGPITESALLSRLAANEFVQKSIRVVVSGESIPEASSLSGVEIANETVVVRRGNSNLLDIEVLKHICSFSIEASIYSRECGKVQSF